MPACSICSRSAKHAHMTLLDKSYNFCSEHCMAFALEQINCGMVTSPYVNALQDTIEEMKEHWGEKDLLSLSPEEAVKFCGETLWRYQSYASMNSSHTFIPTTWEESYIKEACLPAVGRLPFITIETAVPVIIDAFEKECFSEIPF